MIHLWSKIKDFFSILRTRITPGFIRYKHRFIRHWKLHARYPFTDAVVLVIGVFLIPIFALITICDALVNVWNYEPIWYIKVAFVFGFVCLYFTNSLPQAYQNLLTFLAALYIPVILYHYNALFDWSMPVQFLVDWTLTPFLVFFILRAAAPEYVRNDYFDPWGLIFYARLVSVIRGVFIFIAYTIFYWVTDKFNYWYPIVRDAISRSFPIMILKALKKKCVELEKRIVDLLVASPIFVNLLWWCVSWVWPGRFSSYWPDGFYDDVKLFFFKIPHTSTYNFIVKSYYRIRFKLLTSRVYNYIDDWFRFKLVPFLLNYPKEQHSFLPVKLTVDQIRRLPPGTVIKHKPIRITISIRYRKFKKKLANCYRIFIFNKKIFTFLAFLITYVVYKIFF